MSDKRLFSFEIVTGSQNIRLYRDDADGSWFIARRRGKSYEFFYGEAGKSIWHQQEALVEKDPVRLLQIFTLACATLAKEHALADFLRRNHEKYVDLLDRLGGKKLKSEETLSILEEPQGEDIQESK